ncbi:ribonucleoside-diphosphate reductase subunit alpha [Candidatus Nitrosacidococcus sp. I8]|uniref:ribonucleoside-diphosphate reductase subunit alpha n=1 Tax=Candidatus Nitrosacidococcus sp. I8 TaxID=2942908 RepID=UPI0024CD2C6B|nr:ribonucleoside-diphosphate reductase subunit alpha [Candidatus Nitrosacidococcus sp. I8]CAH9019117.1 hypothetical protein NURINAE_01340 [Candidatus Nitrosacidococcus sp. I8]
MMQERQSPHFQSESMLNQYQVIRRNGKTVTFDPNKIAAAITKAFLAVEEGSTETSKRISQVVDELTKQVVERCIQRFEIGRNIHIEDIQDQVELALMRGEQYKIARVYMLYREKRAQLRAKKAAKKQIDESSSINVVHTDGTTTPIDKTQLIKIIEEACEGLSETQPQAILNETLRSLFDGISIENVARAMIMSARTFIEKDPQYSYVAARLLLDNLRRETLSFVYGKEIQCTQQEVEQCYPEYFTSYIQQGIKLKLIDPKLGHYDLERLGKAIEARRDFQFTYLGLQTLYDRYFIHTEDTRIELPQAFFMRVAMGLAINEDEKEEWAIRFYHLLSSFDFMSSTPTLFNSGTIRPQLSSCYVTTVPDDLEGIYNAMKDNALLSKYAGGLGNDWTYVRGMGAHIQGTNGKSQGVVPFLKVANDTAVAVNQGGKRKGAVCAYLEVWHIDIEEFLDLRKNTGDDRRRTHDMNTSCWVPDLFMKRVIEDGQWALFSPDETPDLHDLVGADFECAYLAYEKKTAENQLKNFKIIPAKTLWRKMLSMLFETGHPWITFKDPCNIRSPQQHVGVIHSSNLCTEITLNTSKEEIAVCNLGSVNLPQHINEHGLDHAKLEHTVTLAMRMLDNVIDYNYYAVPTAQKANQQHRPVGLGVMGFQDALYKLRYSYASQEAVQFADCSMESISYYAILASSNLAKERGSYPTFPGSLWSKGILPIDSIDLLARSRGGYLQQNQEKTLDWEILRDQVKTVGMRNSNCMAIAPTATISNICGVSQSIEPTYQNLFVKSNLSGEFTVINPYLVKDLKNKNLWDEIMVNDLKYFDGSVQAIDRIPEGIKKLYLTVFEINPHWLIEAASRRQKWIDQAQSLNLYIANPSGKKLDSLYKFAWQQGLKTTYYLRSIGATHVEKSTIKPDKTSKLNAVQSNYGIEIQKQEQACSVLDSNCESCQ